MKVETVLWDPTERLGTVEAQQAYLEDALEVGDPTLIVAVIGDIARARHERDCQKRRDQPGRTVQVPPPWRQSDHQDSIPGRGGARLQDDVREGGREGNGSGVAAGRCVRTSSPCLPVPLVKKCVVCLDRGAGRFQERTRPEGA